MPWLTLGVMALSSMVQALLSPFFWLVVLLVAVQHHRLARTRRRFLGIPAEPLWLSVFQATLMGIMGGCLGSGLLLVLGVSLTNAGLPYVWPLAIALMLLSPHLLCFAYAGGLLALSSLAFGLPQLEVPQLMGLVGALHLVESFLILLSGHRGAMPVYLRLGGGEVVGGFNLQRLWPIPLVATALVAAPYLPPGGIEMPAWWPLIKPADSGDAAQHFYYLMLPVAAALGYGDLALTSSPTRRSRRSALTLLAYSVTLILLAVGASYRATLALPAALFAPLGHELTIILGRRAELRGPWRYVPPPGGVMVLDAVWGTPAYRAGLRSGSILRTVNGRRVAQREEFAAALEAAGPYVELEYTTPGGEWRRVGLRCEAGRPLGLILVPEAGDAPSAVPVTVPPLVAWWHRLFRK